MHAWTRLVLSGIGGALTGGLTIAWLQHRPDNPALPRLPKETQAHKPTRPPELEAAFPALPDQSREFRQLDPAAQTLHQTLIQRLGLATDDAERLILLDQLEAECYSVDLIGVMRTALTTPGWGEAARLRAIDLLAGNLDPSILVGLEPVRRVPEANLRAAALMAAARVRSGFTDFALPALNDPDALVRLTALEAVAGQSDAEQERLYAAAVHGQQADAALYALGELAVAASPANLPILFTGLDAPLAEVRDETRLVLNFLLDQEFANAAAASAWWAANRHRYDADLVLKQP